MDPIYKIDSRGSRRCPYDRSHLVTGVRFIAHLMKCQRRSSFQLMVCPWNATHHVYPEEFQDHVVNCESREFLDFVNTVPQLDSPHVGDLREQNINPDTRGTIKKEGGCLTSDQAEENSQFDDSVVGDGQLHCQLDVHCQLEDDAKDSQHGDMADGNCKTDGCICQLNDKGEESSKFHSEGAREKSCQKYCSLKDDADRKRSFKVPDKNSHLVIFDQLSLSAKKSGSISQLLKLQALAESSPIPGRGRGTLLCRNARCSAGPAPGLPQRTRGPAMGRAFPPEFDQHPTQGPGIKTTNDVNRGQHDYEVLPCSRGRCGRGTHVLCGKAHMHPHHTN